MWNIMILCSILWVLSVYTIGEEGIFEDYFGYDATTWCIVLVVLLAWDLWYIKPKNMKFCVKSYLKEDQDDEFI